ALRHPARGGRLEGAGQSRGDLVFTETRLPGRFGKSAPRAPVVEDPAGDESADPDGLLVEGVVAAALGGAAHGLAGAIQCTGGVPLFRFAAASARWWCRRRR